MIKKYIQIFFIIIASPFYAAWKILSFFGCDENSIQSFSQFLSLVPGKFGALVRAAFYSLAFKNTSQDSTIEFLTTFSHNNASFGKHFYTGIGCNIGWIKAEDDVRIGAFAYIASGRNQHNFDDPDTPIRLQGGERTCINLGRDCWVGVHSCVYADVGEGSIVSPHSVVTKPVPPFSIVGGNPARVMGRREKAKEPNAEV